MKHRLSSEFSVIRVPARKKERQKTNVHARYSRIGVPTRSLCKIVDLTTDGARIETFCPLEPKTIITLQLPTCGTAKAEVVWSTDLEAGCLFLTPLSDIEFQAILESASPR